MSGDSVDDASYSTAAVKKCCRPFNDLDSFNCQNVDRLCVIAGLKTKTADLRTILQNRNAIAGLTSNHWASCAGPEASLRDSEFSVKCFTQ